ncbi:hypothetical protein [Novosphingobium sp. 28-62-57]|uniref:hypothetical protein n=1 Tax=Novosphingobium sp. 28-62-57 TaxID=1970409 RepID=UPI0025E72253|nr:hypothetical protein [Novosphingobium sp. 28-62-57]
MRPALGQAQACADALASIDLGVLRWMARRMREPGYSGRELYETALHGWPKEIAAYGVDRLATELRGLGLDSEAA